MNPTKAIGLRPGDTIGVVAPAGPVKPERLERALNALEAKGFRTKTYDDIFRGGDYLAGDDETRACELMAAFADPETSAVWCGRGGYGVVRLLERIDFDVIRRNPKVFVGFSDITVMHLAIQNRVGLITFHGPNLQDGFGAAEPMSPTTETALWRAVRSDDGGAGEAGYVLAEPGTNHGGTTVPSKGVATGRLTGGNLSVLCGLLGTRYEIETAGRVLFLEDVNEPIYRVDRFLAQLTLAGKLKSLVGIALGAFSYDDGQTPEADAARFSKLFRHYLGHLNVPIVTGVPAGHQRENFALPINALVEVDADAGRLTVCESTVLPRSPST